MTSTDTQSTTTTTASEPFVVTLDPTEELLRSIVEPIVEEERCELVHLEVVRGKTSSTLRLFVDQSGEDAISIAALEQINRSLGDLLDVEDEHRGIFRGRYDLEVSSPGVDRPLAKRSHFESAIGKRVRVKSRTAISGTRQHAGTLVAAGDDGIGVARDDDDVTIGWRDIASANIVYEFEAANLKKRNKNKRSKRNANQSSESNGQAAQAEQQNRADGPAEE